jgi:cholest-4-en-3-one 26-monooxygenase
MNPYGADLTSHDSFVDDVPHDTFRRMRNEAPVFLHEEPGQDSFWCLTKYKDVWKVSLDNRTFSSARGTALMQNFTEDEKMAQREIMLNMDPPVHTKNRRLVNMGFSPKVLNKAEIHIRDLAREIVDSVAHKGHCDFVTDIAAELPLQVIVEMLGVPKEDRHAFFQWSNTMIGSSDPEYCTTPDAPAMASMQLFAYADQLADSHRAHPREDLTTTLLNAEIDGERLRQDQFQAFVMLLAVAGNETTRNLISGAMHAFFQFPDQWQRLLKDPSLMDSAVEEMLRFVSPVMQFKRTPQHDIEIRGQKIREGERIIMWYIAANRDEETYSNPDQFDIGRSPNDHLAFGIGPHFCLGNHLARMEIKIMFQELLRRLPDIQQAGKVQRLRSNFINGVKHLPVEFSPERR